MIRWVVAWAAALSVGCGVQTWSFGDDSDAAAGHAPDGNAGTDAACGSVGHACCPGGVCATGEYCRRVGDAGANICSGCGGPGETCCALGTCNAGGCCADELCAAQGALCPELGGTCQAGSCGTCGGSGQPCCKGECTAGGLKCEVEAGTCVPCTSNCGGS